MYERVMEREESKSILDFWLEQWINGDKTY